MSSQKTEHYELNQWLATDQVLRTDFNADNAKIDTALAEKAQAADLEALSSTVSGLSTTVAEHTAAIAGLGNCQIYTTSYAGNDADSRTHTFPGPAAAVFIAGLHYLLIALRGNNQAAVLEGGNYHEVNLNWSGQNLTISYTGGEDWIGNELEHTYYVVALIDAAV